VLLPHPERRPLAPPGARLIELDGVQADLKFDVRAYAYDGRVLLLAARMYAGQTTNFRTPGGGFAPVVVVPQVDESGVQGSSDRLAHDARQAAG
jgi:hypothetical protein